MNTITDKLSNCQSIAAQTLNYSIIKYGVNIITYNKDSFTTAEHCKYLKFSETYRTEGSSSSITFRKMVAAVHCTVVIYTVFYPKHMPDFVCHDLGSERQNRPIRVILELYHIIKYDIISIKDIILCIILYINN